MKKFDRLSIVRFIDYIVGLNFKLGNDDSLLESRHRAAGVANYLALPNQQKMIENLADNVNVINIPIKSIDENNNPITTTIFVRVHNRTSYNELMRKMGNYENE